MRPHTLIVRADGCGDVLLTGPAVRAVAARAGLVTYLTSPQGAAAAHLLPGVDAVMVARLPWIDAEPEALDRDEVLALIGRIALADVDEAVIFTSFHQSPLPTALLLRMAGVARVGAISVDYPGSLLDVRAVVDDDLHEVQRSVALAAAAGYPAPPGDDLRLAVRTGDLPPPPRWLPDAPYVVVHPGASVPARAWAPSRQASLVTILAASGWPVVVTGGRAERALTARVSAGVGLCDTPARHWPPDDADDRAVGPTLGRVVNAGGRTDLAELAVVLGGAAAVVVGNTGPAHLAAAVGAPVVSVYAPTVPAGRWRPWMTPHIILGYQDIGCGGCRARSCPVAGHPCIDSVDAPSVVAAVNELAGAIAVTARPAVIPAEPSHPDAKATRAQV